VFQSKNQRKIFIFLIAIIGCTFIIWLIHWTLFPFSGIQVITPLTQPFKVLNKKVKAGGVLEYQIHYYKSMDIPGEIFKQLIGLDKNDNIISAIPLTDSAGHLPGGKIKLRAFARIPDFTPPGIYYLKLSPGYNLGSRVDRKGSAITEKFEVIP
jgi:hypothetical protein